MSDPKNIEDEELEKQDAEVLPERTAMSLIRAPGEPQIAPDDPLDLVPPPMTE